MMYYDVLIFIIIYYYISIFMMMYSDLLWDIIVYYNLPWFQMIIMISYDLLLFLNLFALFRTCTN